MVILDNFDQGAIHEIRHCLKFHDVVSRDSWPTTRLFVKKFHEKRMTAVPSQFESSRVFVRFHNPIVVLLFSDFDWRGK